jgi:integrase/recombinase XerC
MILKRFLSHLQYEKRFSAHTIKAYEGDLTQFFDYLKTEYQVEKEDEVTHFIVRSWIVSLMDNEMSPRSVNRKISSLKSYFRFLIREGVLKANPLLKIQSPKTPKPLPVFIDENRMDFLFDQITFPEGFAGLRDRTILELFYVTGMRLSELVNLETKDISVSNMTIKVLGKRNKERIIPLSNEMIKALKLYLPERAKFLSKKNITANYLFVGIKGLKVYPKFVYRLVKKYLSMVTTGDKKNPHILRHTFATHMLNNGAEINAVKELLGHASLAATQVYTHNTTERLKNIYKQAHPKA